MNWSVLLYSILSMGLFTQAVSVTEAFKKDWVQYNSGPAVKHALIDQETMIELLSKNLLYYRDLSSAKIRGYIDLSLHSSDDFKVGGASIATFSNHSNLVSIFEKDSGIFVASIQLKTPPIQLLPYGDYGWTFLQDGEEDMELVTWDGQSLHILGKFYAHSFLQYPTPQGIYICVDSSAFMLTAKDPEDKLTGVQISNADYGATFDLLFPQGVIYEVMLTSENPSPLYITDNLAASYHNTTFVIYTITGSKGRAVYEKTLDKILTMQKVGNVLAVVASTQTYIFDLTKYIETGAEASIQYHSVKAQPHVILSLLTSAQFMTLSEEGNEKQLLVQRYELSSESSKFSKLKTPDFSASGDSIIVNVPPLLSRIEEAHHLTEDSLHRSVIHRWLLRVKSHLSQLGQFTVRVISRKSLASAPNEEDVFGFNKILIQVDALQLMIAAKSSRDGATLWTHEFSDNDTITGVRALGSQVFVVFNSKVEVLDLESGKSTATRVFDGVIDNILTLSLDTSDEKVEEFATSETIAVKIGNKLEFLTDNHGVAPSQYVLHQNGNAIQALKVDGQTLKPTWEWNKPGQRVLALGRNSGAITPAGGIARSDRSVLYKYLNPNIVSIISEDNGLVRFVILDGITGTVIFSQEHKGDLIDFESVQITQQDNWVVYSMFVTSPKCEQRLFVVDLFQDAKSSASAVKTSFDSVDVTASTKSFLYPEKILSLESTNTKFGVTVKSIIALTESGSLVEIPKYLLNSRRIDGRKMTSEDQMDDYRMLPYEPVIAENTFKVLNHKFKLQPEERLKVLILPTELESTSVVCFVNELNDFCTIVQPSSSYDLLKSDFDKTKLLLTIAVLVAAYVFSKPLVDTKKLSQKWVD